MTWPQGDPYGQQQPPGYDPYSQPSYPGQPYSGQPAYDMYGQPSYPQQTYQAPAAAYGPPPTNGLAIASLVCSIAGFVFIPVIGEIVGVVLGHIAKRQIVERGQGGDGLATAGLIVGYIGLGLSLLCGGFELIWFIVAISAANNSSYNDGYTFVTGLGALLGF